MVDLMKPKLRWLPFRLYWKSSMRTGRFWEESEERREKYVVAVAENGDVDGEFAPVAGRGHFGLENGEDPAFLGLGWSEGNPEGENERNRGDAKRENTSRETKEDNQ